MPAAEHPSATAAAQLLESLTVEQRAKIQRPFAAAEPPTLMAPRMTQQAIEAKNRYRGGLGETYVETYLRTHAAGERVNPGLPLHTLDQESQRAVVRFLQSVFSPSGFKKINNVMLAARQDESGGASTWIHPSFALAFFGAPSATDPWIIKLSGDHLVFVVRFEGAEATVVHSFIGARRVTFQSEGIQVRVLGAESDKAFALFAAFDEMQREQVASKMRIGDLTLWPEDRFPLPASDRLHATGMSMNQRQLLTDLIFEWAGMLNPAYTSRRLERLKATIPDTWLVWAGPGMAKPGENGSSYFRVHGPHVFIEFAPQLLSENAETHTHATYREL